LNPHKSHKQASRSSSPGKENTEGGKKKKAKREHVVEPADEETEVKVEVV
jgi:hypothetical protein